MRSFKTGQKEQQWNVQMRALRGMKAGMNAYARSALNFTEPDLFNQFSQPAARTPGTTRSTHNAEST
jgi:hypothetical protein